MRRALIAVLAVLLAGCARGPDVETLKADAERRLAAALPAGTVAIDVLERRGSQSDTKAPAGEKRRIVYYDVVLRLERDFDFGAWDSPGTAGLVSALGAGPKGVAGITSGGNKAGDRLYVHGTALYAREEHRWVGVAPAGFRPVAAPSYAANAAEGPAAVLEAMRAIVESIPAGASRAEREAIEQELLTAHAAIRGRLARLAEGYAVAAGPEHGQYLRLARALAAGSDVRIVPLVTRGGEENLRLLHEGKVTLALAQGDAALDALQGTGNFSADGPYATLQAVGSLYPEPVHVLVRGDSAFSAIEDLKGGRVVVGVEGSASRATALRVLAAHGLEPPDIVLVGMALGDGLVAVRDGRADAVIQIIGVPADSVRDALAEVPLRLLPLSKRAVERLVAAKAGYFAYTIPRGTYATQAEDVRTIATAALLLAGAGLSEAEVGRIARLVFRQGRDLAARGSAQGTQVSAANARQGLSVPLHRAAASAIDAMAAR
ncbi:MAG TPA: TAXI family TRAP transporter solute-binding subunit [Burkholderiales bacterium]